MEIIGGGRAAIRNFLTAVVICGRSEKRAIRASLRAWRITDAASFAQNGHRKNLWRLISRSNRRVKRPLLGTPKAVSEDDVRASGRRA
jgi:hypothetical protein